MRDKVWRIAARRVGSCFADSVEVPRLRLASSPRSLSASGINSAVFRIADRVLLRAPDRRRRIRRMLRRVNAMTPVVGGTPIEAPTFSYPGRARVAENHAFSGAATYARRASQIGRTVETIAGIYVDSAFFICSA